MVGFGIKGSGEDHHGEVGTQGLPSVDMGLLVNLNQSGSCRVGARGSSRMRTGYQARDDMMLLRKAELPVYHRGRGPGVGTMRRRQPVSLEAMPTLSHARCASWQRSVGTWPHQRKQLLDIVESAWRSSVPGWDLGAESRE